MLELACGGPTGLLVTSERPLSEMEGDKFGCTPTETGPVLAAAAVEGLTGVALAEDLLVPSAGGAIVDAVCLLLFNVRGVLGFRELGVEGALFNFEGCNRAGLLWKDFVTAFESFFLTSSVSLPCGVLMDPSPSLGCTGARLLLPLGFACEAQVFADDLSGFLFSLIADNLRFSAFMSASLVLGVVGAS